MTTFGRFILKSTDPRIADVASNGNPRVLLVDDNADRREHLAPVFARRWDINTANEYRATGRNMLALWLRCTD